MLCLSTVSIYLSSPFFETVLFCYSHHCPTASDGKIAALRFLLDHREDINSQDANGCTPLIIAAQHEQAIAIVFLIKNGCDTTLRDCNGDSALHWAAYKGFNEILALLAHQMANDIDSTDEFGQVCLHPTLDLYATTSAQVRAFFINSCACLSVFRRHFIWRQ
jgi:Ankyrin repeats (3 copies)